MLAMQLAILQLAKLKSAIKIAKLQLAIFKESPFLYG